MRDFKRCPCLGYSGNGVMDDICICGRYIQIALAKLCSNRLLRDLSLSVLVVLIPAASHPFAKLDVVVTDRIVFK